MSQGRTINWVSDSSVQIGLYQDRKLHHVRQICFKALQEQSQGHINYYDFLLVAKTLNFRFQESSHLMELRKFFFSHGNSLANKKLSSLLLIDEESLKQMRGDRMPHKLIIRFAVQGRIESIKQVTNQDEDVWQQDQQVEPYSSSAKLQRGTGQDLQRSQEYQQKLTIILSIKVTEMMKKINLLMLSSEQQQTNSNLINIFDSIALSKLPYQVFKKGTVGLLKKKESIFTRLKLTMSQEDIRAIFTILDEKSQGQIDKENISLLLDQFSTTKKITKYYQNRVNQRMVKNTLFKLGRNSNSIQIYQVKNASVLEFKSIQEDLLHQNKSREKLPKRIPHFGPIKGLHLRQSPSKQILTRRHERHNYSSLTTYKQSESNLSRQREKIEQIIRSSKDEKKKSAGNDTIANKLRKLFIHKVILPREKLLQQQKTKYSNVQGKSVSNKLVVKLV